jgi:hypothetical protein
MKRIIISTLFLLLSTVLFAQISPVGHLTVFSENGDKFYLILNGEKQNDIAQTNIRVEDLNQPYYNAKIIFVKKGLQEISKDYLTLTDADGIYQDVTYKIKNDKKNASKRKLNFFSMIPVRQDYTAPSNVYVVHYGQPVNVNPGINVGINMNVNINDSGYSNPQTSSDSGNHHGNHNSRGCSNKYEMASGNFSSALASIKKQGFDETKLKMAKQIASANCLNTNQIIQICKLFGFEDNKLDFAKYAYDFCVEPKNYFKLNDVFSFSSNVDDLTEYIQNKN